MKLFVKPDCPACLKVKRSGLIGNLEIIDKGTIKGLADCAYNDVTKFPTLINNNIRIVGSAKIIPYLKGIYHGTCTCEDTTEN